MRGLSPIEWETPYLWKFAFWVCAWACAQAILNQSAQNETTHFISAWSQRSCCFFHRSQSISENFDQQPTYLHCVFVRQVDSLMANMLWIRQFSDTGLHAQKMSKFNKYGASLPLLVLLGGALRFSQGVFGCHLVPFISVVGSLRVICPWNCELANIHLDHGEMIAYCKVIFINC